MLKKAVSTLNNITRQYKIKTEERKRMEAEKRIEEELMEQARIKAEKDALLNLSEKELMVEAIMALRGYNLRITKIESQQVDIEDRLDSLESDITDIEFNLQNIKDEST